MILRILGLAWALDFTPTHDGDAREAPDPPSLDPETSIEREPPTVTDRQPVDFPAPRASDHVWLDPSALELAVSGDAGRRYYVVGTVFAGPEQFHLQVGPIDAPDSSVTVQLPLPEAATAAVLMHGQGMLMLQVSSSDFAEVSIRYHEPPEPLRLTVDGAAIVGSLRSAATYPLATEASR